jgi:hypothetical protein
LLVGILKGLNVLNSVLFELIDQNQKPDKIQVLFDVFSILVLTAFDLSHCKSKHSESIPGQLVVFPKDFLLRILQQLVDHLGGSFGDQDFIFDSFESLDPDQNGHSFEV